MENKKDYLSVKDNKLVFNYNEKFDLDEFDCFYGEFNLAEYKKEKKKLNGSGNFELLGNNCSIKFVSDKGLVSIVFSEGNQTVELFGLKKKNLA